MTTLIADGTYYIVNVQYTSSYVNLTRGLPYASINSWTSKGSTNQEWIVKNIGGNQITLENVTAKGYFASVYNFSKAAPVFASQNPTYWTVAEVSSGVYTLTAEGFQLALTQDGKLATILLGPLYDDSPAAEQHWKFGKI